MLKWLLEPLAPATFTKAIYVYDKGDYNKAYRLLEKAAKWMPELREDALYCAYKLLIRFHLYVDISVDSVNVALDKIRESKLRGNASAKKAERELNFILTQLSNDSSSKGGDPLNHCSNVGKAWTR